MGWPVFDTEESVHAVRGPTGEVEFDSDGRGFGFGILLSSLIWLGFALIAATL